MPSLWHGDDLAGLRERACSTSAAALPRGLIGASTRAIDACVDEERVTRLPPEKGISDVLWRSLHLPRHLYRENSRIISDEHLALDE